MRRPDLGGTDAQAFGYAKAKAPIFWVFIVLNAIEVSAVHVIIPWLPLRYTVDVLGLYGMAWMLGALASIKVHPHLVDAGGLRVRNGLSVDIRLPWAAVASIRTSTRILPTGRSVQLDATGTVLSLPSMSQTRIDVALRRPTAVTLPKGNPEITELHFSADDPQALVAAAQQMLTMQTPQRRR